MNYFYTAKSVDGKTVKGNMIAKDARDLAQILKDQELILVDIKSEDNKKKNFLSFDIGGVPDTEKILLTKNLSVMIATGMSLVNSFAILSEQTKNKKLKSALLTVQEKISSGESLSSALSIFPDIFSDFFRSMIQVGEESGSLVEVLKILSLQLEKEHRIKSKIQGAMVYPSIVLVLLLGVGVVLVKVVLPSLGSFFEGLGANIPFYTRMLLDFGKFSEEKWYVLVAVPVIFVFMAIMAFKTKTGKWLKDTVFIKTPLLSNFAKKHNCATLIRSLSSLLGSGVPLVKSLEVAQGTVDNFYFKKAVSETLEKIKKGKKMSESLADYKEIFPFGAIEMMEVGEETGKTSTVLKSLADFYEEELIAATEKLTTAIEPIMIIVLGLMVGFFAISVIQPMYTSLQSIM